MSRKLFVQIVMLIIIAAFVMVGTKCLMMSMCRGKMGMLKCPMQGTMK